MSRTQQEIQASIETHRMELARSLSGLRGEIVVAADWRRHFNANKQNVLVGAAVAGFVVGGGIAALFGGRRRRSWSR